MKKTAPMVATKQDVTVNSQSFELSRNRNVNLHYSQTCVLKLHTLFQKIIFIWWGDIAQGVIFNDMQRFLTLKKHVKMTANVIVFMMQVATVDNGLLAEAMTLQAQAQDLAHGSPLVRASHVKYKLCENWNFKIIENGSYITVFKRSISVNYSQFRLHHWGTTIMSRFSS